MDPSARSPGRLPRWQTRLLLLASLLPAFAALTGDFVYDDRRQILANPLIQRPELLISGLLSDVWAFKGEAAASWSSYWRPTFVLWLSALWRLFGADPLGYRIALAALHAGVVLLARSALGRLGWSAPAAFAIALLFAVHPVHVESVAWIAGAPDPLFAAALLAVLLAELAAETPARRWLFRGLGGLAAVVAFGAKEAAIGLPLVVGIVAAARAEGPLRGRLAVALRRAAPYFALGLLYLALRVSVLGAVLGPPASHPTALELAMALPRVLAFYLRQALFPVWIAPTYPMRFAIPSPVAWLPVVFWLGAALLLARAGFNRAPGRAAIALALFLVPLAPAFHLTAFQEEQLVHDRYLYLPLLGILALAGLAAERLAPRLETRAVRFAPAFGRAALFAAAALLATRSLLAAADYRTSRALFEAAVESDPRGAYHLAQLAEELFSTGEIPAGCRRADEALALAPATTAYLVRAKCRIAAGEFEAGRADLELVVRGAPNNSHAWDLLAMAEAKHGDLAGAERTLRAALLAAPQRTCSLSGNLAIVLYLQGRREEAATVLESIRDGDPLDANPACELALYRLGTLRAEQGDLEAARRALESYLERSAAWSRAVHDAPREAAARALREAPPG